MNFDQDKFERLETRNAELRAALELAAERRDEAREARAIALKNVSSAKLPAPPGTFQRGAFVTEPPGSTAGSVIF